MKFGTVAASLLALCASMTAQADLLLDKNFVEFLATEVPRKDITLSNSGNKPSYVDVEVSRIENPGTENEQRLTITDPRELGLLASPRRLKLEAGESRRLRLTLLKRAKTKDEVFRVKITPSIDEFGETKGQLQILIAYDALVIARPPNANALIDAKREGNQLTLTNNGNTSVLYYNGQQCDETGENCRQLAGRRIYGGTSRTLELPYDASPVKFLSSSHERETKVVVH